MKHTKKAKSKYPAYPGSNWDYAVKESARQQLRKPNKSICLYCREQAISEKQIKHKADCPYELDRKGKCECGARLEPGETKCLSCRYHDGEPEAEEIAEAEQQAEKEVANGS